MAFMTRQYIFNTAYHGLTAQGFAKSFGRLPACDQNGCLYRGPRGMRCAIGYCISDNIANSWESRTIQSLGRLELEAAGFDYKRDFEFLKELQQAHDLSSGSENMKKYIHGVALQYGLTIPTLPVSADGVNVNVEVTSQEDQTENQNECWIDFETAE